MRTHALALLFAATLAGMLHAAAPRLGPVVREDTRLRLEWLGGTGPFQLEESPSPLGPWQPSGSSGAATSAPVTPDQPQRFFRVRDTGTGPADPGEAAMRATLDAVGTFVGTVPRADRVAWRAAVLGFLRGRTDIDSAGESPDGVWAITADGIPLAIWNNRPADPAGQDDARGVATPAGTETPGKSRARFAVTVGAGFTQSTPRLSRLLAGNAYTPVADAAPLDSLKGVRPESVFFLNTHGGTFVVPIYGTDGRPERGPDGKIRYENAFGLWSGTKIDPRNTDPQYSHNEYVAEFRAKRLAIAFAPASYTTDGAGNQSPVNEWHFGITAKWVRDYLSFPKENHASVWLAACRSGSADAAPMRAALRAVGAEMVSGWTGYVDGDGVQTATSFVFDRLLGANKFFVPATPQRPFGYEDTWTELRSRGLHRHPSVDDNNNPSTTDMVYEGDSGDEAFGLFAPSIAYLLVSEPADHLHLVGLFGKPPESERQVLVGGTPAHVVSWDTRKVVVDLPRKGDGSAGDVQVVVRGHRSNVRRLTRWTLTGTYQYLGDEAPHVVDGTLTVVFRADIGEYRRVPGNVFVRPTRNAPAAQSSEVYLEAKGIVSSPCGNGGSETDTWSGSGMFPTYDPGGPQIAVVQFKVDTITGAGALALAFGMRDPGLFPLKDTVKFCDGPSFEFPLAPPAPGGLEEPQVFGSPLEETLPDGSPYEMPLPGAAVTIGADWAIPAGQMSNALKATWKWNRAAAEFPPDPQAAR